MPWKLLQQLRELRFRATALQLLQVIAAMHQLI
jgi:hypothetical protein